MLRAAMLVIVCSFGCSLLGCVPVDASNSGTSSTVLGDRTWQTTDPVPLAIDSSVKIVNIGVGPWLTRATQSKDFQPILDWLEESTGFDCVLNISPNYESLQVDLLAGHVDVAILSAAAYADVLSDPNSNTGYIATVIAGPEDNRGSFYKGYIFTRQENGKADLQSLKGNPFAFVDRGSSSGFHYPMALLLDAGLVPDKDFKTVFYLGSHDRVVAAVTDGQVYAGAVWDSTLRKAQREGAAVNIIAETKRIPREAWVAGAKVSQEVTQEFRKALTTATLETRTKTGQLALGGGYLYSGFKVEGPEFYKGVRAIRDVLKQHGISSATSSDTGE